MYTVSQEEKTIESIEKVVVFTYSIFLEPIFILTSDIGWGCTYRCGQMMLYNSFKKLGITRYNKNDFKDEYNSIFSIHNMVKEVSIIYDKYPGSWLGPYSLSFTLKKLTKNYLNVHIGSDNVLCQEGININEPNLLLIPLQLGVSRIDDVLYSNFIKSILNFRLCNGIIGGKPRSSYYIIGYSIDHLIYLDPHVQDKYVGKMEIKELDPSILVSFTTGNQVEYEMLEKFINEKLEPKGIIRMEKENPFECKDDDILTF